MPKFSRAAQAGGVGQQSAQSLKDRPSGAQTELKVAANTELAKPLPKDTAKNLPAQKTAQENSDKPEAPQHEFKPMAGPAKMKTRHYGIVLSFFLVVVAPLALATWYLYWIAEDQYVSTSGFTVRSDEGNSAATDLLGGLAAFTGAAGGGSTDGDILFEFITSQELVQRLNTRLNMVAHYSEPYERDPYFALQPDAAIEDLVDYWQNVVDVNYTQSTGLMELTVNAFTPEMAQAVSAAIIDESTNLVNGLNSQARTDSMQFAELDLETAIERLRSAREGLTRFRTRTQIVDPMSDLQGRMGVLNNLQQQLAEALIEYDLLSETTTNPDDPRLVQSGRRIDVIRDRISAERLTFTSEDVGENGEDYPTLMAEFEGLVVEREFAEETYRAALTAFDAARTNASRQSRYLAVFINPTQPESSEYPNREVFVALSTFFLLLGWFVMVLVYYSVRDRQ